jgi:3-dehydroquinate synthase
MSAAQPIIRRSAELHREHILGGGDPFEQGSARPLDHGHWAAHRLEAMSAWQVPHGQAVAIGIALDACIATEMGMLEPAIRDRILHLLQRSDCPPTTRCCSRSIACWRDWSSSGSTSAEAWRSR